MSNVYPTPYGFSLPVPMSPLELELYAFRHHAALKGITTRRAFHFRRAAEMIWGEHNKAAHFYWNPWDERMLECACAHPVTGKPFPHLSLSGCASSGKTDFGAVWALINWLCDPINTGVLVTSTTLSDAQRRVWGRIKHYWMGAGMTLPGRLIDSDGIIVTTMPQGQKASFQSGVQLLAGQKSKEKEAIGKLIGFKNKRVILVGDELPELTEAILEAAFTNLISNETFQMLGLGNFKSRVDPFGVFTEPVQGYNALTLEDTEWETKYGWA